ncbi:hypothetical protein [Streptomyces albipurpureus]|uniref:Secreted protein n=1 Tax=Streptomyces albipurpureus TaxID=2897419 RepID=A0ABT0UEK3_9ACTN|nr:hypothetical protein [Streptomyces sp. CWNU-1]MCM2386977.1 hypothetical protein [Streptomyces sp. CWNU-1]
MFSVLPVLPVLSELSVLLMLLMPRELSMSYGMPLPSTDLADTDRSSAPDPDADED